MKTNGAYQIDREKFMNESEMKKLIKVCQENSELDLLKGRTTWVNRFMLIDLAFHSGLRVSEISALKIGDIFLNGKEENYLIVRHGKRDKKRDVYVDREIARHIKSYIEIKKKSWKESIEVDAPLFAGRGGKHFTSTALEISFKKAIEKAGLPSHYSIHCARHTYATLLLSKTNNLRFVQKQLGHSNLNMTSLYADILPELKQNLANSILD